MKTVLFVTSQTIF